MTIFPEPNYLDFLLAQVSRLHQHRAHERLEKLGLYRGQPPVLFALWQQDGLTQTELAERLGVTPATTTKMLQRMEKTGFVQRRPDPGDQRVSRVYLTEAGRAVQAQLETFMQDMEMDVFRGFSDDERVVMRNFLLRLRENLAQSIETKPPD
jgi:DNA-binding MarR family transcriptional regulator